ncbi:MAG: hypothetical protein N2517_02900 [Ignavibacteria bacterium]|nr:hypothetical protein [Ignavibacteria bacterium]
MDKRKLMIIIIILFSLLSVKIFSQKVVVSEYNNVTGDPLGEWTELLVIEDNIDLVGYTLRDNAGSTGIPVQWTGGIRFKNHPLWRNLRAGTIIVINHRYASYQNVDVDKRDGYIEIDAENETYFDKRCFSCVLGPDWYEKALNIAQESDIIQILDQNDNHIHALAHLPREDGSWLNVPSPRAAYPGSIPRGGVTVRIAPGRSISAYNIGFDTRGDEATQSADYVTKGKPNNRSGAIDVNQLFWRSLREPSWSSQTGRVRVFSDSVVIGWEPVSDANPSDSTQGYIVVRILFDQIAGASHPVDGVTYSIGQNLGTGVVVGEVNYSQATRFLDRFTIPCGSKYVYRVYAYRYRGDDLKEDTREVFARGRSYNQREFAEIIAEKPQPRNPIVSAKNDKFKFCEGDNTILYLLNRNSFSTIKIEWFVNGNLIPNRNSDTLVVWHEGVYTARITDSLGCTAISSPFNVVVLKYPQLSLSVQGRSILRDTAVSLCPNQILSCKVDGWFKYSWFRDGVFLEELTTGEYKISRQGEYYAEAYNELCTTRTPKILVKIQDLRVSFNPKHIQIFVGKDESFRDTTIKISNEGNDTVFVSKLFFTGSFFELIDPKIPFAILPKSVVEIKIRFQPLKSGIFKANLILERNCNFTDTVEIEGIKSKSTLILSKNSIELGVIPDCISKFVDTSFFLVNDVEDEVQITNTFITPPFTIINPQFPFSLQPGGKINFHLALNNLLPGVYESLMKIFFVWSGIVDSLQIPIKIEIAKLSYNIVGNFSQPVSLNECELEKTVQFSIKNNSKLELKLNAFALDNILKPDLSFVVLKSFDSLVFETKVIPDRIGSFTTKLAWLIEPCGIVDTLEIKIEKRGFAISFAKDTIDFGSFAICNDSSPVFYKSVPLSFVGDTSVSVRIKNLNYSNEAFALLNQIGTDISKANHLDFVFRPKKSGNYKETIEVLLEPCDFVFTFTLIANFVNGRYRISSDRLTFGTVEIGKEKPLRFSISNYGDTLIRLGNYFLEDNENFRVNLLTPTQFPNIQQNEVCEFELTFKPTVIGRFGNSLIIPIVYPCTDTIEIALEGESVAPAPNIFNLYMGSFKFRPFTYARLPIRLSHPFSNPIKIDSLTFLLSFNNRSFDLKKISADTNFVKLKSSFLPSRKLRITAEFKDKVPFEGVLCSLEGMVLVGDERKSEFKFSNIEIFSEIEFVGNSENGILTIDSVCAIDLRLISSETLPKFYLLQDYGIYFLKIVSGATFQSIRINIYNSLGQNVFFEYINELPSGESLLKLSLDNLSSGLFFVVVDFGTQRICFPLMR